MRYRLRDGVQMSADWLGDMLDEMLDETTWSQVIDCVNCGHVPAHSPYCEVTGT